MLTPAAFTAFAAGTGVVVAIVVIAAAGVAMVVAAVARIVAAVLSFGGIVFDMDTDSDRGHARSIMSFAPTGITIDLTLTDEKSEVTTAHIAFLKG